MESAQPSGKCRFHLLLNDAWMQLGSFSTFSLFKHPMNSDETALCHIMMNLHWISHCNSYLPFLLGTHLLRCIRSFLLVLKSKRTLGGLQSCGMSKKNRIIFSVTSPPSNGRMQSFSVGLIFWNTSGAPCTSGTYNC